MRRRKRASPRWNKSNPSRTRCHFNRCAISKRNLSHTGNKRHHPSVSYVATTHKNREPAKEIRHEGFVASFSSDPDDVRQRCRSSSHHCAQLERHTKSNHDTARRSAFSASPQLRL